MKKITEKYNSNAKKYEMSKRATLIEGALLLIICILILQFDSSKSTITFLYLCPLYLTVSSLEYTYLANNKKDLNLTKWLILIFAALIFILIALFVVISKSLTDKTFIMLCSSAMFIRTLSDFITKDDYTILGRIKFIAITLACGLVAGFSNVISTNYSTYFIIGLIIMGIIKIIRMIIYKTKKD